MFNENQLLDLQDKNSAESHEKTEQPSQDEGYYDSLGVRHSSDNLSLQDKGEDPLV